VSTRTIALPLSRSRRAKAHALDAATAVAVRAFLGSRLIVWSAGLLALAAFGRKNGVYASMDSGHLTAPFRSAAANFVLAPAARWDSAWYLQIAHSGYATKASSAFFPLYPLLIHATAIAFGSALVAGTLISSLALAVALVLLYRLTRLDLDDAQARSTVMLVAFFPTAFFLSAVYTEALFLMLSVGAVYAARLDRWAWAGVLGGLAAATRSGGVLILLALAALYLYGPRARAPLATNSWRRPRRAVSRSALWLALVPAGLLAYMGYLGLAHHAPLAPFQAEAVWGRQFAGPLGGLVKALATAPADLRLGLTGKAVVVGAADPISWPTHNLLDLAFAAFAGAGLVLAWRRVPRAYLLYAIALLAQALSYPTAREPLVSFPRYLLAMFPLFMGWGAWLGECHRRGRSVILASALLLAAFSGLWTIWAWVA
jgi:Mannosyltransferase (PIG-V)